MQQTYVHAFFVSAQFVPLESSLTWELGLAKQVCDCARCKMNYSPHDVWTAWLAGGCTLILSVCSVLRRL